MTTAERIEVDGGRVIDTIHAADGNGEHLHARGYLLTISGKFVRADLYDKAVESCEAYVQTIEKVAAERDALEAKIYLPGHWRCPKCKFYCVSTNIHVDSGGFSANEEPQQCANGCGPLWRVTHEESANEMVERCETLVAQVKRLTEDSTKRWGPK